MTLNDYQRLALVTAAPDLDIHGYTYHALHGLASEVGEIHAIYQKVYQGHEPDTEHLEKELGDLLWFVAELAAACGWNLDDVAEKNIAKLRARYPEGFDSFHSLHRREGDV